MDWLTWTSADVMSPSSLNSTKVTPQMSVPLRKPNVMLAAPALPTKVNVTAPSVAAVQTFTSSGLGDAVAEEHADRAGSATGPSGRRSAGR